MASRRVNVTLQRHAPMDVAMVTEGRATNPDPPLDQSWSDLDKLRWHAGVVRSRTGYSIDIVTGSVTRNDVVQEHLYGYAMRGLSGGSLNFHAMWTWLNGFEAGATAWRKP